MAEPTKKPPTAKQREALAAGRKVRAANVERARREREERLKAQQGSNPPPPAGNDRPRKGKSSDRTDPGPGRRPLSERGGVLGGLAQAFRG